MKLFFILSLLFSSISFSQVKPKFLNRLMIKEKGLVLKSGDSTKTIDHGDMVFLGKYRDRCIARRDFNENLRLDCRASLKEGLENLNYHAFIMIRSIFMDKLFQLALVYGFITVVK